MEFKINCKTKAVEKFKRKNGRNEGWKQNTNVLVRKSSEKKGADEKNEVHTFYCSFLFSFLYGNVTILKTYLNVFPETSSYN